MHVTLIEDARGDLVDVLYYCDQSCATDAGDSDAQWWPGGMDTDYDLYCSNPECELLIQHGLHCDCEDRDVA